MSAPSPTYTQHTQKTHALAITSLLLAILGLTPILPLVGSIAAIVTGIIARREILNRPDEYIGEGMARAGVILGWIGILLGLLTIVALIAFLMPFTVTTATMESIEQIAPVLIQP